jgi:hypothetical protein
MVSKPGQSSNGVSHKSAALHRIFALSRNTCLLPLFRRNSQALRSPLVSQTFGRLCFADEPNGLPLFPPRHGSHRYALRPYVRRSASPRPITMTVADCGPWLRLRYGAVPALKFRRLPPWELPDSGNCTGLTLAAPCAPTTPGAFRAAYRLTSILETGRAVTLLSWQMRTADICPASCARCADMVVTALPGAGFSMRRFLRLFYARRHPTVCCSLVRHRAEI